MHKALTIPPTPGGRYNLPVQEESLFGKIAVEEGYVTQAQLDSALDDPGKSTLTEVLVAERMYRWVNWTFEQKSHEYEKKDAQLVHFPVTVPANGETVITYTVKYTW